MNRLILILTTMALLAGANSWAADDAEATIRLMSEAEAELPEVVTRKITLPAHLLDEDPEAQVAAIEKAEKGLQKANERIEHRSAGQQKAEEVRDRGAEAKENAMEDRENRGRSDDHPSPPESPPGRN